ncbi:MAG: pilus assembly protein PilY, partial [Ottowia sp.]|nr:pilus assembly protein PilY [Ottowia sp.]
YQKDGFPAYTSWEGLDPFDASLGYSEGLDYTCLKNSVVVIGDIHTHDANAYGRNTADTVRGELKSPSDAKNVPDAIAWRKVVHAFETGASVTYKDGSGKSQTTGGNPIKASFLAYGSDHRPYNIISGLAYWAHTHDIRGENWTTGNTDSKGNSKVRPGLRLTTYAFDVNEGAYDTQYCKRAGTCTYSNQRGNQYWLAAKYGGFKTQPDGDGDTAYNTHGNPFKGDNGAANNLIWSDLNKAQGDNTDGKANPEPRSYYMPANARGTLKAFDDIFGDQKPPSNRSIGGADSIGGLGGTSFQATFTGSTWSGDVLAESIVKEGGDERKQVKWCASNALAALGHTSRNIIMGAHDAKSATANTTGFEFKVGAGGGMEDVVAALQAGGCTSTDDCINWLRGDDSIDGLRARGVSHSDCPTSTVSVLGDILNSGVKYVGPPAGAVNLGAGFDAYIGAQADRQSVVYVGANDGMLHAFNADDGRELFAYIPSWMKDKLAALTAPNYIHQPYVDATPVIGDAIIKSSPAGDGSDWATVLVGGTGGGGKGVFALNVTNPTAFDKNSVLWEFTD